jgi:ribosomal protein L37E
MKSDKEPDLWCNRCGALTPHDHAKAGRVEAFRCHRCGKVEEWDVEKREITNRESNPSIT